MKRLLFALLAVAAWVPFSAVAATVDGRYPVATQAGIIEEVDFATHGMIVSGYHYQVAIDARVEIGGTHGAFTLLRPGMRIRFDYLHVSGTDRRIILVQELPPNVVFEDH